MGVTVAAAWYHQPLVGIVHHLGLALFYKGFGSRLVAYIDILAVLHGKGLYHLVALGGVNLAIDHKVGSRFAVATGEHAQSGSHTDGCDERQHLLNTHTNCLFHFLLVFWLFRFCKDKQIPPYNFAQKT